MYNYHIDQNRRRILISAMDDSHLTNFIKMVFNKIENCKQILTSDVQNNNKFISALLDYDTEDFIDDAKDRVKEYTEKLYPYLAEAMLRGIYFTEEMQKLYERPNAIGSVLTNKIELDFI